MTRKEVKRTLGGYRYEAQYYQQKVYEIEKLKCQLERMAARTEWIGKARGEDGSFRVKLEAITREQLAEEERLMRVLERKHGLEELIDTLPQPYRTVLYLHYISLLDFSEIAKRMSYSIKRIYQLHSEALERLSAAEGEKRGGEMLQN